MSLRITRHFRTIFSSTQRLSTPYQCAFITNLRLLGTCNHKTNEITFITLAAKAWLQRLTTSQSEEGSCRLTVVLTRSLSMVSEVYLGHLDGGTRRHPSTELVFSFLDVEDQRDFGISRIGGFCALPPGHKAIPDSLRKCSHCGGLMLLVAQLWGTYDTSPCNRVIYLGCCSVAASRSDTTSVPHDLTDPRSWRAVRVLFPFSASSPPLASVKPAKSQETSLSNAFTTASKFVDTLNTDDWLAQLAALPASSVTTESAALLTTDNSESRRFQMESVTLLDGPALPAVAIDFVAAHKTGSDDSLSLRAKQLAEEYEQRCSRGDEKHIDALDLAAFANSSEENTAKKSTSQGVLAWDQENYEETPLELKLLGTFERHLASSPSQVLRYAYGSKPLWPCFPAWKDDTKDVSGAKLSEKKSVTQPLRGPPLCSVCGSSRVFEFQLMPYLWTALRQRINGQHNEFFDQLVTSGDDCSTVAVFTCANDCQPPGNASDVFFAEESVAVCPII